MSPYVRDADTVPRVGFVLPRRRLGAALSGLTDPQCPRQADSVQLLSKLSGAVAARRELARKDKEIA